jgi:hypothetical protein
MILADQSTRYKGQADFVGFASGGKDLSRFVYERQSWVFYLENLGVHDSKGVSSCLAGRWY